MGNCVSRPIPKAPPETVEYADQATLNIGIRNHVGKIVSHKRTQISLTFPINQHSEIYTLDKPVKVSACVLPGLETSGEFKPCQDNYSITFSQDMLLCGVFDGHGPIGEKISEHSKKFISEYFLLNIDDFKNNTKSAIVSMLEECDKSLEGTKFDYSVSGSTAVVLLITPTSIHTASLGDSRAVLGSLAAMSFVMPPPRNKYCRTWQVNRVLKPIPLTIDQKPNHSEEYMRIKKSGGCVEKVIDISGNKIGPYRVWIVDKDLPGLAMSRSIGDKIAKTVGVISTPVYHSFNIYPENDQYIIMASDGIWDVFDNIEVINFVEKFKDKCQGLESKYPAGCWNSSIARLLCEEARYRWFDLVEGEDVHIDDISCIVLEFCFGGEKTGDRKERNVQAFMSLAAPNEYVETPEVDDEN